MRRIARPVRLVVCALVMVGSARAADEAPKKSPGKPAAKKAPAAPATDAASLDAAATNAEASAKIDETMTAYMAAYNAGDVDAVMRHWADDADFTDFRARSHQGKDAIGDLFRRAFAANAGRTVKLTVTQRRFLSPELAMDDGVLELTGPDGDVDRGRYVSVWGKNAEGQWLIRGVRDMPPDLTAVDEAIEDDPLAGLVPLVGDWTAANERSTVELNCHWLGDRAFLVQEYRIRPTAAAADGAAAGESRNQPASDTATNDAGSQPADRNPGTTQPPADDATENAPAAEDLTVTVWIGWDPIQQQVRGWFFDSSGGFGEGAWARIGDGWKVNSVGVLPDARTGTSTYRWTPDGADGLIWAAHDREVDGQSVPDVELKFTRRK